MDVLNGWEAGMVIYLDEYRKARAMLSAVPERAHVERGDFISACTLASVAGLFGFECSDGGAMEAPAGRLSSSRSDALLNKFYVLAARL